MIQFANQIFVSRVLVHHVDARLQAALWANIEHRSFTESSTYKQSLLIVLLYFPNLYATGGNAPASAASRAARDLMIVPQELS